MYDPSTTYFGFRSQNSRNKFFNCFSCSKASVCVFMYCSISSLVNSSSASQLANCLKPPYSPSGHTHRSLVPNPTASFAFTRRRLPHDAISHFTNVHSVVNLFGSLGGTYNSPSTACSKRYFNVPLFSFCTFTVLTFSFFTRGSLTTFSFLSVIFLTCPLGNLSCVPA